MDAVSAANPSLPAGSEAAPVRNTMRNVISGDLPGSVTSRDVAACGSAPKAAVAASKHPIIGVIFTGFSWLLGLGTAQRNDCASALDEVFARRLPEVLRRDL